MSQPPLPGKKSPPIFFRGEAAVTQARRDPDLVWPRATLTIENIREGSSVIRQFVALRPTLTAMFNNSLRAD